MVAAMSVEEIDAALRAAMDDAAGDDFSPMQGSSVSARPIQQATTSADLSGGPLASAAAIVQAEMTDMNNDLNDAERVALTEVCVTLGKVIASRTSRRSARTSEAASSQHVHGQPRPCLATRRSESAKNELEFRARTLKARKTNTG